MSTKPAAAQAREAIVNGSLKELYINSIKLEKNECTPSRASTYKEASLVGAEMALTPLEISSEKGQALLKDLLNRSLTAQITLTKDKEDRNPSIDAWIASLLWQHGDNRISEFVSANYAASAIDGLLKWSTSKPTDTSNKSIPLGLVNALSVLDGYLAFPIIEFSGPSVDDARLRDYLTGGTPNPDALLPNAMPTILTNDQLKESLNRGMARLQDVKFLALREALYKKRLIRKLNNELLERFSRSLFLSTHMLSHPKDAKNARQNYHDQVTSLIKEQQTVWKQTIDDLQQSKSTTTDTVFELAITPLELINISNILPDESSSWVDQGPTIDYRSHPLLQVIDTAVNRGGITRSRGESLKVFVLRLAYERSLKFQTLLDEIRYATVKPGERMKPRNVRFRVRAYCMPRGSKTKFVRKANPFDPTGTPEWRAELDWELGTSTHEIFVQPSELPKYLTESPFGTRGIDLEGKLPRGNCDTKNQEEIMRFEWVGEEANKIIADRQDFIFRNQASDVDRGYFIEARNEHLQELGLWVCEDKEGPSKKLRCPPSEMGTLWNLMQMHNSGVYFSDSTWLLPRTTLR